MTVGIAIKCKDGIVVAGDSLTTFSRGVPIKRYSNKVYIIEHECLRFPVAVVGAGISAYIDKFVDEAKRDAIPNAFKDAGEQPIDIIDFCNHIGEPLVAALFKKYYIERNRFFGAPIGDFSLYVIVAGATRDGELRAFILYPDGVTENIPDYGTIGSGAGYAELFLRNLLSNLKDLKATDGAKLSVYAIKGVEIMDPNVGGDTNVLILRFIDGKLEIEGFPSQEISDAAWEKMKTVLAKMGDNMQKLIK
jgi:20S proteasome alpha/beta subunit